MVREPTMCVSRHLGRRFQGLMFRSVILMREPNARTSLLLLDTIKSTYRISNVNKENSSSYYSAFQGS